MSSVAQADGVQALSMTCFLCYQAKEVPGAAVGNNWASEFDTQQEAQHHEDVWKQFNGVSLPCLPVRCCHCRHSIAWQFDYSDSTQSCPSMITDKAVVCLQGSCMQSGQFTLRAYIEGIH